MSTREFTKYPDEIIMDSPIGQAKLAITDANHVSISANVVTIRGKEVRAHLHVNDYGCGVGFEPSRDQSNPSNSYHALYATKAGSFGDSATDAQRKVHLEQAVALFTQVGAATDAQRARDALNG